MAAPLILGGIEVTLHSGAAELTYSEAGGATDTVLSGGAVVRSRHWSKELITISAAGGWMATGLDALDWDAEHLLLCNKPKRMATMPGVLDVTLTSDPRPDVQVFAHALVGRDWVPAEVVVVGRDATVTPVAGAVQYRVGWYPMFTVLCARPPESSGAGGVDWQLVCREA